MAENERFEEAVSDWLENEPPARLPERVLNATFERTRRSRQHRGLRALLGRPEMLRLVTALGGAAVLVVVAAMALNFYLNQTGIGGRPTASPWPSPGPVLLARGNFDMGDAAIEVEATTQGSAVTGHMTSTETAPDGVYAFTADLECTRTTEDGLLMIGGYATDANEFGDVIAPVGSHVGIVFKRGTPEQATIWTQRGGPAYETSDCLAYLDQKLRSERSLHPDGEFFTPIDGAVEFGPAGAASTSAALLARGNFYIRDWDRVEFEATRDGSRVTGSMTLGLDAARRLGEEHAADLLRVDLECARTTEDGLLMIGGVTDAARGRFANRPGGALAAIVLKRGSPVSAAIWDGSISNAPATQTTDCLAYLDAWLTWSRSIFPGDEWLRDDIEGTVEFGPQ